MAEAVDIQVLRQLFDLQRNYKYKVYMPMSGFPPEMVAKITFQPASNDPESFTLGGKEYYLPGTHKTSVAASIEFHEMSDGKIVQAIQAWRFKVQDEKGRYGYPRDFTGPIIIQILSHKNIIHTNVTLVDSWPSTPQPIVFDSLSGGAPSNVLIVTQDFTFNAIKIEKAA